MTRGLKRLSKRRGPWLLLAFAAAVLEVTALAFQYIGGWEPCVLCIYERVAILMIFAAGLIGAIAPRKALFRWSGILSWAGGAGWGMVLALEHVEVQTNPMATCEFFAKFPDWMKLDQWLPHFFEPRGLCTDFQWHFLGYSMPQWMIVIFGLYLFVMLLVLLAQFRGTTGSSHFS